MLFCSCVCAATSCAPLHAVISGDKGRPPLIAFTTTYDIVCEKWLQCNSACRPASVEDPLAPRGYSPRRELPNLSQHCGYMHVGPVCAHEWNNLYVYDIYVRSGHRPRCSLAMCNSEVATFTSGTAPVPMIGQASRRKHARAHMHGCL